MCSSDLLSAEGLSSRLKYCVILLKVYFLFFYLILIIPSSLRCRQDQFAVYIFLAYCQLTEETLSEALKGGGGGGGEGELIYFKHV